MQNNTDKLDYLIALAASKCLDEEAKALMDIDTSNVQFDAEYYRKRKQAINKYNRRSRLKCSKTVAIRLLVAIMIMVMLSCALIGCVPKWRRAIYEAIVEWYNDCFVVRYEETDAPPAETRYPETTATETEEAAAVEPESTKAAPDHIEEVRKPRELPDGVWEDVVKTSIGINIDYYFNDELLFSFTQRVLKSSDKQFDSDGVNITYVKINEHDATVVEYGDKKEIYILWSDGEYAYHIFSTECDMETLVQYAESVK